MAKHDIFGNTTAFVTTARAGSFTAAADQLGITKSAVGKAVSRLEERLGVTLFHRTTRNLSLTPDGERYLASCQNALDILENAEAELTSRNNQPSGRLRLDLPAAFGRQRILPILLDITRRYPELALTLSFSERFVDLVEEGIDLVVRIGELEDSSTLVARQLTTQKLVLCASPGYLARNGRPHHLEELANHQTVIGLRRSQAVSWIFRTADGKNTRYTPPATHQLGDGDAMLIAVLNDAGISQLPRWLVGQHLQSGALVELLEEHAGGEMPIHAVWARGRTLPNRIRFVVDELIKRAANGELD